MERPPARYAPMPERPGCEPRGPGHPPDLGEGRPTDRVIVGHNTRHYSAAHLSGCVGDTCLECEGQHYQHKGAGLHLPAYRVANLCCS